MKHLEKITISNVRRFGENVEINIGKGATIFLAPNGTGKTAIFEAIELALTGRVKRLLFPPEPLIRDLQLEASIKLDFEDGKFCQAIFKKGEEPVLSGSHKELFGKVEEQDLPFLLQLTHFLNQQGNNWFVNSHGPDAGSQLDHLSIGREATEVNQLIPSAKRAAGNELSAAQRNFDESEAKWQQWLQLLNKRSQTNIGLINELVDRDTLLNQMNAIAVQFKDFEIAKESKLFALKILNAELLSVCNARIDALKKSSIELRSFYSLISEFDDLSKGLTNSKSKLNTLQQLLKSKEAELLRLNGLLSEQNGLFGKQQTIIVSLQDTQRQFNQQQLLDTQIKSLDNKSRSLDEQIKQIIKEQDVAKANLSAAQANNNVLEILNKRIESINTEQRKIEELKIALQDWNNNNTRLLTLLNLTIPASKDELTKLSALKINADKLEISAKDSLEKSQQGFNALNQTVDIIKAAVGTIIAEYPKDKGDCPVCGTDFQPNELQRKMAKTAQIINPGLNALADLIEKNRATFNETVSTAKTAQSNLINKQSETVALENEANTLVQEINLLRANHFTSCQTIQEAEALIQDLIKSHTETSTNLNRDKENAPQVISNEQLILLTNRVSKLDGDLLKHLEDLHKISVDITSLTSSLQSVSQRIDQNLNIDQISENLKKAEDDLVTVKNKINEIKTGVDSQSASISVSKDEIIREEINISQMTTRLSEYRSRWVDAKQIGDPNKEGLDQSIQNLDTRMSIGENYINELDQINRELSKWQVVEDNLKVEDEIKLWRGEMEESLYHQNLDKDVNINKEKLKAVSQNMEILTVFSECLSRELDVVHEKIVSINPLWKKLLKRIIIDPRFSHTQLDSFSYYKKQHANVNVKLHGGDVLVSQVASEAQITDLQLTFMLAMAQKYQWTTWKSLLLDDPTQHHDLVHTSAVFDLLRDYIADFDFQILMATHDPVQAKFFMRKLENDGIPVNICTLFATEDGVEAKIN